MGQELHMGAQIKRDEQKVSLSLQWLGITLLKGVFQADLYWGEPGMQPWPPAEAWVKALAEKQQTVE